MTRLPLGTAREKSWPTRSRSSDTHLRPLQNKQYKEIARAIGRPMESVMAAFDFIRTLDPKPGARYNQTDAKLIEPDAAFVKHGDEWLVMMNEDDVPQLAAESDIQALLHQRRRGERCSQLRERALQVRDPAHQEH